MIKNIKVTTKDNDIIKLTCDNIETEFYLNEFVVFTVGKNKKIISMINKNEILKIDLVYF